MNNPIALYCKSFKTDVKRTLRLARSVDNFNADNIPFYVSVPSTDIELFNKYLKGCAAKIIEDESIIRCNSKLSLEKVLALHGGISQQIIKSEFWRLGFSESYVCLDSDSMFIRPFYKRDFLVDDQIPYTVIDEGHELLESALATGKTKFIENFSNESIQLQEIFGRNGKKYSFGPNPPIWNRQVWHSLETEFLQPKGMNFYDAILQAPVDLNWYGEALLKYRAIPLFPSQPLFKVYAFAWQYDKDKRRNMNHEKLATIYSGVIYQSAWERNMDWPSESGNLGSRIGRRIRRLLGRI